MNRTEIKELAKSKIKGNKWNIIWPVLVIGFLESVIQSIFKLGPGITNIDTGDENLLHACRNATDSIRQILESEIVQKGLSAIKKGEAL